MSDKFLKTYEEVKAWLEQMNIRDYSIDKNLLVDVHESVDISNKNLSYLPKISRNTLSFRTGM